MQRTAPSIIQIFADDHCMCNYYLLKVSNVLIEISYYTYRKHDPLDELTYFNAAKRQIGKRIKRNNLLLAIFSNCKLPTDYCSISTVIECDFPGCLTQPSNLKFERSRPSNNVQKLNCLPGARYNISAIFPNLCNFSTVVCQTQLCCSDQLQQVMRMYHIWKLKSYEIT